MQRHFDEDLEKLKTSILLMAASVDEAILASIDALKALDVSKAKQVIAYDRKIDERELDIDEHSLSLLAKQQPMAVDLRFITVAMNISTDLERIADLAVDIAQRVLEMADKPLLKPLIDIPQLAAIAQTMTKDVIQAFFDRDVNLAQKVILFDSKADALRNAVQSELINDYMIKDPKTVSRAVPLLLIARHLERICDHATNIAEDVIYMVKAEVVKHHPERLRDVG